MLGLAARTWAAACRAPAWRSAAFKGSVIRLPSCGFSTPAQVWKESDKNGKRASDSLQLCWPSVVQHNRESHQRHAQRAALLQTHPNLSPSPE